MKIFKEIYTYETVEENESQYDGISLFEETFVTARYVRSNVSAYQGNPFIEALPPLPDKKGCQYLYTSCLPDYSFEGQKQLSIVDRISQLAMLGSLRLPLPFHYDLEVRLHDALARSYAARYQLCDQDRILKDDHGVIETSATSILISDESAPVSSGFALLGNSGCGKSTAIQRLTSRIPQVIFHPYTTGHITQITYLVVVCSPNSNFNALYMSIGTAIDRALGITTATYEQMIRSKHSLGEKSACIRHLIEVFAIGAILFDEIQLIDFDANKDNSFESLLTLSNQTKVAICVIGTKDAYEKMFPNLRTTRRIGSIIEASAYCNNIEFFRYLVTELENYQWFDTKQTIATPELTECLFRNTGGIINQLITVYQTIQYDYLKRSVDNRKATTPEYIRQLIDSYYPGYHRFLQMPDTIEKEKQSRNFQKMLDTKINFHIADMQETFIDTLMHSDSDNVNLRQNVIRNIQKCFTCYNVSTIETTYNQLIARSKYQGLSESELTQAVLKRLSNRSSDARPKKSYNSITNRDLQESLMKSTKNSF